VQLTQAILPVAGLGTRFLPWTKVVPKELLPLGNEPIIAHIVDECMDAGITDICFVISKGKESIPQYFYDNPALEAELERRGKRHLLETLQRYNDVRFHTVYQEEQLGDGHAILQAKDWVKSDAVAVLFGDDLFAEDEPGLVQLRKAHERIQGAGAVIALENIPRELTHKYGIAEVSDEDTGAPGLRRITSMVEKPDPKNAPSTLGIVGRYIIPRSTFDVLPDVTSGHGGEIRLIDALIAQIQDGVPVYGCTCAGKRIDTGTPEGYREALRVLQ